jgi:hypothetical protein
MMDLEIQDHLNLLEKSNLKSTGWNISPLENAKHDFVNVLL